MTLKHWTRLILFCASKIIWAMGYAWGVLRFFFLYGQTDGTRRAKDAWHIYSWSSVKHIHWTEPRKTPEMLAAEKAKYENIMARMRANAPKS